MMRKLNKISEILIYTLFFTTTVVYTRLTYDHFEFVKEIYLLIIIGLLGLVIVAKKKIRINTMSVSIGGLAIFLILLNFISRQFYVFQRESIYLVIVFLASIILSQKINKNKVFVALFLAGGIALFVGYLQYFGYLTSWHSTLKIFNAAHSAVIAKANYQGHWPYSKPISTLGNENFFSEFLMVFLFISLYFYRKVKILARIFIALLVLLILIMLIYIFTRATILSIIITALLYLWFKLKKLRLMLVLLILSLTIFSFLLNYTKINTDSNIKNRVLMYKIGSSLTMHKPIFGLGFGRYKYIYPYFQGKYFLKTNEYKAFNVGRAAHTHDEFIQALVELGIPITALIITLFIAFFRAADKRGVSFFIVFALVINSFFSFPFHLLPQSIIVLFLLLSSAHYKTINVGKWSRAVIALLSVYSIIVGVQEYLASVNMKRGTVVDKINQAKKVPGSIIISNGIYYYENALNLLPIDFYDNNIRFKYMEFLKNDEKLIKKEVSLGRAAYALNPYMISTTYDLAKSYYRTGEMWRADNAFRMANEINPRQVQVYEYLMKINRANQRKERFWYNIAKRYVNDKGKLLEVAIALNDNALVTDFINSIYRRQDTSQTVELARYFLNSGNYKRAFHFYNTAIRESKNINLYIEVANIYVKMRRYKKALKVLVELRKQTANSAILSDIDRNIGVINGLIKAKK